MTTGVRYIVNDTAAATDFYTSTLGFRAQMGPVNGFAMLVREDLRLFLNEPGAGSAGLAGATSGAGPEPGGWNRFQIEVDDLDATIERLSGQGAHFRGEQATGRGGRQILVEDPSGNVIELFERATR